MQWTHRSREPHVPAQAVSALFQENIQLLCRLIFLKFRAHSMASSRCFRGCVHRFYEAADSAAIVESGSMLNKNSA